MPQSIQIGELTVRFYGIIFSLAVLSAYLLIGKLASQSKVDKKHLEATLYIVLIFGLVGARFYHVFDEWNYYSKNPIDIIKIWNGGIGIYGGLILALVALVVFCKTKKQKILPILDVITPGVLLAQAIGRWGNYFNQEAYGYPSSLPWAIKIDAVNRLPGFENFEYFHPTFLYESLLAIFFVFILVLIFYKKNQNHGLVFACYLVFYGITRLITEHFRIDTWQQGGLKIADILSMGLIFVGLFLVFKQRIFMAFSR